MDALELRLQTGLTQREFADAFGIAIGTLRDWEQGRREPDGPGRTLLRLIEADANWVRETLDGNAAAPNVTPDAARRTKEPNRDRQALERYLEQWQAYEGPEMDADAFLFRASLTIVAATIEREFAQLARSLGITVGELRILFALRRVPAPHLLRSADLLRQVLVTSGAISKQLNRLERRGLVKRAAGSAPGSGTFIQLTKRGERLVASAIGQRRATYNVSGPAFARVSARERKQGLQFLRALVDELQDVSEQRRAR